MRAVARGGAANLAGALVTAAAQFALTLLVTRSVSGTLAGIFFTVTSIFLVVVVVANFGANTGLVYFLARQRAGDDTWTTRQLLRAGFRPTIALSLALAAALFALAGPLSVSIAPGASDTGTVLLRTVALFIPLASLESLGVAATRGAGSMRPNVLISLVARPIGQLVLVLGVLLLGGAAQLGAAWAFPYLPAALAGLWWMRRLLARPPAAAAAPVAPSPTPAQGAVTPHRSRSAYRAFWRFSSARAVTSIMQIAMQRLDIVLVAVLASPRDAAVYMAATRFVVVGQMATNSLMMATQPRLASAIARSAGREIRDLYQISTAWLVTLSWPLYLLSIVFADTLLRLFGKEYASGGVVLALVAVAMLASTAFGMVDTILTMSGRAGLNLVNTAVGLVIQIGLDLLLIPRIGIVGAAVGWAVSILVRNLSGLAMVYVTTRVMPFSRAGLASMGLAGVAFLALPLGATRVVGQGWPVLAATTTAGALIYALGLWRLRRPLRLGELTNTLPGGRRRAG